MHHHVYDFADNGVEVGNFISCLMLNHFGALIQMQLSLPVESLNSVVHNEPVDQFFYAGHSDRCVNVVPDLTGWDCSTKRFVWEAAMKTEVALLL